MLESIKDLDDFFLSYMPSGGATGELRDNRLKRMEALLEALGNPERSYKTIHIAGSKGKGSTATLLSSAIAKEYKTGLYRSPHVYDLRERFTLSGVFFSDEEYLTAARDLKDKITNLTFSPTTFELYTAYAYLLFKYAGCEYAVIETGLGGRLDATNTIDSIMEILLPIELEHQDVLGDTIEKIATEKSKIIKRNSIVVVSDVDDVSYSVFKKEAKENNCPFYSFKSEIKDYNHIDLKDHSITYFSYKGRQYHIESALRSFEIGKNIAISLIALDHLGLLSEKTLKAFETLKIEGRFEERKEKNKEIVLDVAHTKESIRNLIKTFSELYDAKRTTVLFSSISGKDSDSMLSLLLSVFDSIIITRAGNFKKSDPDELYRKAIEIKRKDQRVYLIHDEKEALSFSKRISDIILITGSFYLVGLFGEENA